jgi:hypothetical protein
VAAGHLGERTRKRSPPPKTAFGEVWEIHPVPLGNSENLARQHGAIHMSGMAPLTPVDFDVRKIGRTMTRERRQHGWLKKTETKVKTRTGLWYEYVVVEGVEKRQERCRVLGNCAELTKTAAKEKLLDVIRNFRPPKPARHLETWRRGISKPTRVVGP